MYMCSEKQGVQRVSKAFLSTLAVCWMVEGEACCEEGNYRQVAT